MEKHLMSTRTPIPFVQSPPRNGNFETHFPDSEQPQTVGQYKDGLKTGSWKTYYADGQIESDYEWDRGVQHGHELDWAANGQQICDGQNVQGKRFGKWTWWYENGNLKQSYIYEEGKRHGEYVWDQEDGTPRARGEFYDDSFHGAWTWWNEPKLAKIERVYWRGQHDGKETNYFAHDVVAARRNHRRGYKHGLEETFYEDGKPRFKGEWLDGHAMGKHHTWDSEGNEVVEIFVDGLAQEIANNTKKINGLVKKLAKAKDNYKKSDLLTDLAGYDGRAPLLLKLWREGLYDVPNDPETWEVLAEVRGLMTSEEVMTFLKTATNKKIYGQHLPYWSDYMEKLVMYAYANDPAPFDAGWKELPNLNKKGVAFVMARFGKDTGKVLKDELGVLLKKHIEDYGIGDRILWWVDGRVQEVKMFADFRGTKTEYFDRFLEIFTTKEAWIEGLRIRAKKEMKENVSRVSFAHFRDLLEVASPEEMTGLLTGISLNGDSHLLGRAALTEWRELDGETITKIALGIDDTGLRKWPPICCAVLKLHEEGKEFPEALVDAFLLDAESPTYSSDWYTAPLRALDESLREQASYKANYIQFGIGCAVPRSEMIHQALAVLPDDAVRKIFERQLEAKYSKGHVAPFAYRLKDPELWRRVIEVLEADEYGATPRYTWEFAGNIGLESIPFILESCERANKKMKASWHEAIVVALAQASARGEEIPAELDTYISFNAIPPDYNGKFLVPFLARLIHNLPEDRAEKLLIDGLTSAHFASALGMIGSHPTQKVLETAFNRLLEKESTLDWEAKNNVKVAVQSVPNPQEWIRWIYANGGGGAIKDQLAQALGYKEFEVLYAEITQSIEPPKELDHIDKLIALTKDFTEGETMYVLRRSDVDPKSNSLNLIGGPAPGVGAENWPLFDDEPMTHLYTLDLKTIPTLQKQFKKARTISVFCSSPDMNEAWEPDSGWTEVRFVTQAEIDANPTPHEEAPEMERAFFEPIQLTVPFEPDSELNKAIYNAGGRIGGEPMWLQDEEHWGDFVMQFDESFIHMNLGDCGIMYVFADTAFWQCH